MSRYSKEFRSHAGRFRKISEILGAKELSETQKAMVEVVKGMAEVCEGLAKIVDKVKEQ